MQEVESQTLRWTAPEFAYQVTIPATVLDEIRFRVVEAYRSVPRGGVEVGGVFFGIPLGDSLHIQTHRPIHCQYLTGPSFKLSSEDKLGLSIVLNLPASDPKLAGLTAIGWYHSHTRSEIFLSTEDLQLHHEFFPQPWHIAMVLRPVQLRPTRAAFFFRDPCAGIKSDAPVQEFILDPPDYGLTLFDPEAQNAVTQTQVAHEVHTGGLANLAEAIANGSCPPTATTAPEIPSPPKPAARPDDMPLANVRLPRPEPLPPPGPPPPAPPTIRASAVESAPNGRVDEQTTWQARLTRLLLGPPVDSDRRSAKRESGDGLIAFYWEGGPSRAHRVKDISRHGVFVEFEKADLSWTCGTVIMLLLQIASAGKVEIGSPDAVTLTAEVVRTSKEGMGLRFRLRGLSEAQTLLRFLHRWKPDTFKARDR